MWSLRFRPEIETDLREGESWYESKVQGLGNQFLEEFWTTIDRILENPLLYAEMPGGIRPCRLKRFSYIVYYRVLDRDVLVVGVFSGYRDESSLHDRG